jgi:hypothetical protein
LSEKRVTNPLRNKKAFCKDTTIESIKKTERQEAQFLYDVKTNTHISKEKLQL